MAEERNVFEVITDYAVNERINQILLEDKRYQGIQRQIDNQIKLFEELNLDKEQQLIVDRLVSLHTESGALYGRVTYQQGCRDCVTLLQVMNLIKAS